MSILDLDAQITNRDIQRRYEEREKERQERPLKQDERLCVFGCSTWLCWMTKHRKHHYLDLDNILNLTREDIANLDIKKLMCQYHLYRQSKKHIKMTSEKFERYLRAEIYCRLKNINNILGSLYLEKDRIKIENNINSILESKFTQREREGQFCEIEKSSFKMAALLNGGRISK